MSRVGIIVVPNPLGQRGTAVLKEVSEKLGVSLLIPMLASPFDEAAYRRALTAIVEDGGEAVYVAEQYENWTNRRAIIELTRQQHLPAIYAFGPQDTVELGGLMTYSPDWTDQFRHAADQVDQILKGTKPGDIPFYQARKFTLVINLKTAKSLGLEIPNSLLAQADEVIE